MKTLLSVLGALILFATPVWALEQVSDVRTLQSAATATGDGVSFPISGYNTVGVELTLTDATVTWKGSVFGTFVAIPCINKTSGTSANTATTTGSYVCNVAGLTSFLADITTFGSGTVTAVAQASTSMIIASGAAGGGDASAAKQDEQTALLTKLTVDPCGSLAKTHIPIDIVTATTTELTAALAGASTHYYVCSLDLFTTGANNVALVDDDSDGCGSPTSGLAGGVTAAEGWNFDAKQGIVKGTGQATVYKTGGTNRVLCLITSAAVQLSGSIQVVAAP